MNTLLLSATVLPVQHPLGYSKGFCDPPAHRTLDGCKPTLRPDVCGRGSVCALMLNSELRRQARILLLFAGQGTHQAVGAILFVGKPRGERGGSLAFRRKLGLELGMDSTLTCQIADKLSAFGLFAHTLVRSGTWLAQYGRRFDRLIAGR